MDNDLRAHVSAELNAELRSARKWLLIVGILMFVVDMIILNIGRFDPAVKNIAMLIDLGVLAIFVALWWFAKQKPRLCLGLGLAVFWGLQILNAIDDPSNLYKGIIIKVLFTVALVRGLKSANRAEDLRAKLANVFE